MAANLTIELKGLRFFAQHGWHAEEALTGNEFEVTITASFLPQPAVITTLDQTISYVQIYQIAKETFAEREQLLETCAMKMAYNIKEAFPQITAIQVSITKLAAPITHMIGTVGITYTKEYEPRQ